MVQPNHPEFNLNLTIAGYAALTPEYPAYNWGTFATIPGS
jgi:hypothetical protein